MNYSKTPSICKSILTSLAQTQYKYFSGCRYHSLPIVFLAGLIVITPPAVFASTSIKPVKLMAIEKSSEGVQRTFFGRVRAKQTVDLAFQVSGKMNEFPMIEGNLIKKGSQIAQLDLEPFLLTLERATATAEQAARTFKRLKQLQGNSASRASVEDARTALTLANNARRNAEHAFEKATLHSPFDAIVATRLLSNHSTVNAGTPLVRLHDMSELRIEVEVPEVLFQKTGDNPQLKLAARFPATEELFPLEFREVNAEASRIGQTFSVTLGMPTPKYLLLFPGASVTVFVTLLDAESGIVVPASAIHKAHDGTLSVWRYVSKNNEETGTLELIPVDIQAGGSGEIRLVKGVNQGDRIVVSGVDALAEQQRVRPFKSF